VAIGFDRARRRTLKDVERALRGSEDRLRILASGAAAGFSRDVERQTARLVETRRTREAAIIEALGTAADLLQPGLFDRRAESARLVDRASAGEARDAAAARLAWCDRIAAIAERPAALLLVV